MIRLSATLALLVAISVCPSLASNEARVTLRPDPQLQAEIASTVHELSRVNDGRGVNEALAAIRRLNETAEGEREILLLQLALYLKDTKSTEEGMGASILLDRLEFSREEKLEATLPHLEGADTELNRILEGVLGTIDGAADGEADFQYYESVLRHGETRFASALIGYMFRVSPGEALRTMMSVTDSGDDSREILRAAAPVEQAVERKKGGEILDEATVTQARRSLEQVSRAQGKWVRLYVEAILRIAPELGGSSVE